jgi:hypothetical protein
MLKPKVLRTGDSLLFLSGTLALAPYGVSSAPQQGLRRRMWRLEPVQVSSTMRQQLTTLQQTEPPAPKMSASDGRAEYRDRLLGKSHQHKVVSSGSDARPAAKAAVNTWTHKPFLEWVSCRSADDSDDFL